MDWGAKRRLTTFTHLFLRSAPQPRLRRQGGSIFGWISFSSLSSFFFFFLLPSSLSPFLTMNLLVLWDPSRSKQAVTSACSLWRKGSQNLNIYGMQCETKIPVLLVLVFWGLFIAAACVFLGCCPAKSDIPRGKKAFCLCWDSLVVEILSESQLDAMPRMKYHLLSDWAAHSGNHQENSLRSIKAARLLSKSSPTKGRTTDWLSMFPWTVKSSSVKAGLGYLIGWLSLS